MSTLTTLSASSKLRKLAAIALVATAVVTGARSLALFGDVVVDGGNIQTAGTVVLTDAAPTTAILTAGNMAPGDETPGSITLDNDGSLGLRYAMTSETTADLTADQAVLAASTLVITTPGADTICDTADDGAVYSGTLAAAAFGSTVAGGDTGDRELAATTGSETLCFVSTFDLAAGDGAQGGEITTEFTFTAEQTANNS